MKTIAIDTQKGHFRVWTKRVGDNPRIKVLLLHGGPGGTHEYFEAFNDYFPAAGIEYYFYDQLGSFHSDQPDASDLWELPRFVEEVEQVRTALGLDHNNFFLLGHSWGGILALEYALKYQQHLKGLVISNMMASIPAYNGYANEVIMPRTGSGSAGRDLTQPWKFFVLGPETRRAYGLVLGARKAKKIEDSIAAEQLRQKVGDEHAALPLMIAVAISQNENPEIREEDYAAGMMAVQNTALAAVALGPGTHIKSGAVLDDPAARAALGVADGYRIIAMINVGEPENVPSAKPRRSSADVTEWVP